MAFWTRYMWAIFLVKKWYISKAQFKQLPAVWGERRALAKSSFLLTECSETSRKPKRVSGNALATKGGLRSLSILYGCGGKQWRRLRFWAPPLLQCLTVRRGDEKQPAVVRNNPSLEPPSSPGMTPRWFPWVSSSSNHSSTPPKCCSTKGNLFCGWEDWHPGFDTVF